MGDTASARRGGRLAAGRVGIGRGWRHFARSASGSAALVLALLSALVGAAEPAHDDAAHVGGDVYVYDLVPARGLAGGGAAVTVHGSGFNDAMACQFGPRVVPARAVSPEGDRMLCVAPPFPRPSGGFIAVGITLTAGADPSRGVTVPRGARSFEYVPAWSTLSARPSEVDVGGGAVLTILGSDLHAAGSCAFEPHPTARAELHVVSSAMVRCEAPARRPGEGTVSLSPEYSADDAVDAVGAFALALAADAEDRTRAMGVAGVALTARRPARATSATVETSSATGASLVVVAGDGFARAVSSSAADGDANADDDDSATVAADAPSHNGPGCYIGTVWVRASTVDRRRAVCVAPMTWTTGPRSVEVEIRYADASDPGGGSARAGRLAPPRVAEDGSQPSPQPPAGIGIVAEAERWRAPSVLEAYPREGPGAGGDVAWIFGRNLRGFPAPACVFAGEEDAERDARVIPAVVVSSALAACERPPAPVWIHDDSSRAIGVEFASTLESAARASRDGATVAAWPSSTATYRVTPSAVSSAGGTVVSLSGRGYPPSRGGTTCRFGSVGPVAGTRTVAGDVECVSPALAPGRDARVFGPEGRIDPSEAHRAATTIRILDENNASEDEAGAEADEDENAIGAAAHASPGAAAYAFPAGSSPRSALDHPLASVDPAVVVRAVQPASILVHEGATVTVSGTLRGLGAERPVSVSCRFGAVVVLGRRSSDDDDAVECVAPDRAPGETRVAVLGAVGDAPIEYLSPLLLALDASALVGSDASASASPSAFEPEPDVRGVAPRDVVAGSSASERATLVGSNLIVGDAPRWCVFGDGVATLARGVSSAVATCEFSATTGASRIASSPTRRAFRRGADLRTTAELSASSRAPCAPGAAVGCATVLYHPTVPETRGASPSAVGEGGGDAVTVAGSGFPDVDGDGCRFGSLGPVPARVVSASSVTCVTPAIAPAATVRVAAFGAWSDDARVAVVAENRAPTFASPPAARRSGGPRVRAFGFAGAGDDAECRLGAAGSGTVAVAKMRATFDAPIAWWSCDAPTNRAGDAFQALFVVVGVGVGGGGVGGGGVGGGVGLSSVPSSSVPSSSVLSSLRSSVLSFASFEYAEDPSVASAWPAAASTSGGSIVHVVASRGGGGFTTGADGSSRGATCAFGSTSTRAAASSSATARCEVPPSTPGSRALSATREGDGASPGESTHAGGSGVVFAHVPPFVALAATPAFADWSAATTLTISGRGFAPEATSLACRVGTVGPLATTWISPTEVRCVAPAHSGRANERRARVAVVASVSDVVPNPPPTVRFDVDARRLDPRGTPGGRRRGAHEDQDEDEDEDEDTAYGARGDAAAAGTSGREASARSRAEATRAATVAGTHPRVSWGGSPMFVVGVGFPADTTVSEGCRCVFGEDADARAVEMVAVSSRILACGDAPTAAKRAGGGAGIVAVAVRVACGTGGGRGGGIGNGAASSAPGVSGLASGASSDLVSGSSSSFSRGLVPSVSRGTILLAGRPSPREIRPARVPSRGGATTSLVGHGYPPESDLAGSSLTCRFGAVGPVASRRVASDEVQCVTPALAGARRYPAGIAADADAANVAWTSATSTSSSRASSSSSRAYVYSDATLLESLDGRGEDAGVVAPPDGTEAGGARFELFHVAGRDVGSRPRCAFGASSAETIAGSWIVRGRDATVNVRSASCASPSTLASVGFVVVRVAVDGVGLADVSAQFQIHPAARVRGVFPRVSWGPEVTHVSGANLVGGGDDHERRAACVFAGRTVPARAVSSALVTCEVAAGTPAGKPTRADGGAGKTTAGAGVVASATGARATTVCALGAAACDGGGGDHGNGGGVEGVAWFQSVDETEPTAADIEGGWKDGGTLVRLRLSRRTPPEWLDCRFGTTSVPARPASAGEEGGFFAGAAPGLEKFALDMDAECVSPGHAAGRVELEVVPAHSRVPSIAAAVTFLFS